MADDDRSLFDGILWITRHPPAPTVDVQFLKHLPQGFDINDKP
jgi:hypothetical protein